MLGGVDDVLLVGISQRAGNVNGDPQRISPVEHAGDADPLDDLREALAVDVFHGDPAVVARLAGAVERDEVRML